MKLLSIAILFFISVFCVSNAEENTGVLEGLLISVGEKGEFVEIIPDNSDDSVKYIPEWVGGGPKEGGSFKKDTIEAIKKLIVPNRVSLKWKKAENLRVVEINVLKPKKVEGNISGEVTFVTDNCFEIKVSKNGTFYRERFIPSILSKDQQKGGGFDKKLVKEISKLKFADTVSINWFFDDCKRVKSIEIMAR